MDFDIEYPGQANAVIFDPGTATLRAGLAGDLYPKFFIPSAVGIDTFLKASSDWSRAVYGLSKRKISMWRYYPRKCDHISKPVDYYLDPVQNNSISEGMELQSFMKNGMIEDWDMFEAVLQYCYCKCFRTNPNDLPALFTEPAWNLRSKREKLTELMFEEFNVPAFYLAKSPSLTAMAWKRSTALVVDSGAIGTTVVAVYRCHPIQRSIVRSPLGGDFVTKCCENFINHHKINILSEHTLPGMSWDQERCLFGKKRQSLPKMTDSCVSVLKKTAIEEFKQHIVTLNDDIVEGENFKTVEQIEYRFPSDVRFTVGNDRCKIPEGLYRPNYSSSSSRYPNTTNIASAALRSISTASREIKSLLCGQIILTGGNTLIPNFKERFVNELSALMPQGTVINAIHSPLYLETTCSAWNGGSNLVMTESFQPLWISREKYNEVGSFVVARTTF